MAGTAPTAPEIERQRQTKLVRAAIWIAIGTLILAAIVLVIWVLTSTQGAIIGRAFLTILLLALFAGAVLLDASIAPNRPQWVVLASMIVWILCLAVGLVKIWILEESMWGETPARFFEFLFVGLLLHGALAHQRLYWRAQARFDTLFTRVLAIVTTAVLAALVGMLVFYLTFPRTFEYSDLYGRILVALTILAAVGTALVPLVNALFAPKPKPAPVAYPPMVPIAAPGYGGFPPAGWPVYADGRTPLPALPDGSPDWAARHTGRPSMPMGMPGAQVMYAPPAAPDYASVPPPTSAGTPGAPTQAPNSPGPVPPIPDLGAPRFDNGQPPARS